MLFFRLPSLHVRGIRFSQRPSHISAFGTGFPAWHAFVSTFLFHDESISSWIPDWKNSFWIPPMMLMLSMNTVVGKRSRLLSTWTPVIPDTSLIRMISQSTMMAFLSVSWAYACIKMVMKLLNTGRNTGVQRLTGNVAVSVNIPVRQQNTAEPCTSLPMIIQGCLTYRQETQKHGKRNTIEELPWNALISVRKKTIN